MRKQFLFLLLLGLLCSVGNAWGTQTSLITGVTLPDIPTTTLNLSSQTTFTADVNGWIVINVVSATSSSIPTWFALNGDRSTQSPQSSFTAEGSSTTAPFVDCSSGLKINKYSPDAAIRFTGAEKASFLVSARSTSSNKEMDIALFTYDSKANPTQVQVGTTKATTSKDPQELIFNNLVTSNTYIAYIYGGSSGQNGSFMEIALKAPADPTLVVSPTSAESFTYVYGYGPSEAQSFEVTGISLEDEDITVSLQSGSDYFEISSDGSTYGTSNLTVASGDDIYVRLKSGLSKSPSYAGTLRFSNEDTDDVDITLSGSVTNTLYTVTYGGNGGSGTMASSKVENAANITLTSNSYTKELKNFAGWVADVNVKISGVTIAAGTVIEDGATLEDVTGDISLTAQWVNAYAYGTCIFENNATVGTSPNQKTVTTSETAYSAFRINSLFFSNMTIQYESGIYSGSGDDFKGWKIKTNGATIKFNVENNSEVKIGVGNLSSGIKIAYTKTNGDEEIVALTAKQDNVYNVKGGTLVTLTTQGNSTVTLKKIIIASPHTVSFNAGTHGTYSGGNITEASAGAGITLPSLNSIDDGYLLSGWYDAATDGEKVGDAGNKYYPTSDITLYAHYSEPTAPSKPSITGIDGSVLKGASVTLSASSSGVPTPTYQWYSNTENSAAIDAEHIIDGAEASTYSPSTSSLGTKYYYVVATNSGGSATSDPIAVVVTGRTECELTGVVYSNNFDAFITAYTPATYYKEGDSEVEAGTKNAGDLKTAAKNGKIVAYYMAGTSAPTISSTKKSVGSTYVVEDGVMTVTAEDGEHSSVYEISLTSVEPYTEDGLMYNGTENWIKTGYSYHQDRGWRFQKNADDGRISKGLTRLYFFVGHATSVKLINGGITSTRDVNVYVNGVQQGSSAITIPKSSSTPNYITIECNSSVDNMIAIVSAQTGGDGGFTEIEISGAENETTSESITPAKTYTTYVPQHDLDFTSASSLTAYVATAATSSAVTLSSVDKVPAGTPIVIKASSTGSPIAVSLAASTDDVSANKLKKGDGVTSIGGDSKYDYILVDGQFYRAEEGTVAVGKAYLHLDSEPAGGAPSLLRIELEENNATNIENIDESKEGVKFIQNGQLFIKKNGVVYDMLGTVVR